LDRYEWLIWLIDMCDKTKSVDDPTWKALIPVMLSYLPDIAQSELLARRLSTLSARKLSAIFIDQDFAAYSPTGGAPIPPPQGLLERLQCTTHKPTVLGLCSAIQVVLLECPTAMVFNGNPMAPPQSESGRNTVPGGSPLDILPIPPSVFPMPQRAHNNLVRMQLRAAENQVVARSRAVEAKWSCDEWQQSSAGKIRMFKIVNTLLEETISIEF
jgi:mediator of RNA polymerase II transcription subunit 12